MSAWSERSNDRHERERRYEGDVTYDVWRDGGNPDAVDRDRVRTYFDDGFDVELAARAELRQQQPVNRWDGWAEEQQEQWQEPSEEELCAAYTGHGPDPATPDQQRSAISVGAPVSCHCGLREFAAEELISIDADPEDM